MNRFVVSLAVLALAGCSQDRDLPDPEVDCWTGLYQSAQGEFISVSPLSSGGYRWRRLDGQTGRVEPEASVSLRGWTDEADGLTLSLGACTDNAVQFGPSDAPEPYRRVALKITDTQFDADGTQLAGRLVWPHNVDRAPVAIHVHGSESTSAILRYPMPYLLASQGIASFVYDKRGTGQSGDKYTQDFYLLADDANAALDEVRRLAGDRIDRVGYIGGSQGGWVAPLAASQSDVDYVVALFGMAVNPLFEDRSQVVGDLARAGWDEEIQAKGAEIADAAGVIMASGFKTGYEEFDRLRDLYRDEAWYEDIVGEFTGEFLTAPSMGLRIVGPMMGITTSWDYEPVPVLRELDMPQFWMIAADDREAPAEETIGRIHGLQAEGRPIDMAVYPNADHGMVVIETGPDGEERNPGYVENYYNQVAAWILSGDLELALEAGAAVSGPMSPSSDALNSEPE